MSDHQPGGGGAGADPQAPGDMYHPQGLHLIMCGHQVVVPPTIAADQSRLTGRLGEGVVLRCHAHGSPAPTIHWYKSVGGLAGEVRQILYTFIPSTIDID